MKYIVTSNWDPVIATNTRQIWHLIDQTRPELIARTHIRFKVCWRIDGQVDE